MKHKTSRRDFLRGKSSAGATGDAVQGRAPRQKPQREPKTAAGASYLVRVSRRAMACEFEICLNAGQYDHGTQLAVESLDLVETLEDQMSVFRQNSDICRINRTAAGEPVEVEQRLFELLRLAMRLHGETDGALDITSGPLWEVWGFARRGANVPSDEQLTEALRCVGSNLVELDTQQKTVRFRQPGVQLNLGSIGKGHALDRCAQKLLAADIGDFLVHGGQSSVLARGSEGPVPSGPSDAHLQGWSVGVRHPLRPRKRLAELRLCNRALATSGGRTQSFVHKGRRYGHILDPRTGRPAEGVLAATALAPDAATADALSTAFYVMGPERTLRYCQARPEIAALLVCPIRHSGGIEVHPAGLDEGELTML